jgi:hypothetical protein
MKCKAPATGLFYSVWMSFEKNNQESVMNDLPMMMRIADLPPRYRKHLSGTSD